MIIVSERYEAQDLDPLCTGWVIGVGRDLRLDRPVVLAHYSGGAAGSPELLAWLSNRAALSHQYVAELLDLEHHSDGILCVFEGHLESRVGLPNMARTELVKACLAVVDGAEALMEAGIQAPFFGGQVLWDGRQPKLLGILVESQDSELSLTICEQMARYFGSVLEWNILSSAEQEAVHMPEVYQVGVKRLLGQTGQPLTKIGDLRLVLQALGMEFATWPIPATEQPSQTVMAATDSTPQATKDIPLDTDKMMVTRKRLLPLTAVLGVLVIAVLGVGLWISERGAKAPSGAVAATSVAGNTTGSKTNATTPVGSIKIPTGLLGLQPVAALALLQSHGIARTDVQVVAKTVATNKTIGQVVVLSPAAGSLWQTGEQVRVYIAVAAGDRLVPDLLGRTVAQAAKELLDQQFHYTYSLAAHSGTSAGVVFEQQPPAFSVLPTQTTVHFTVAAHY